MKLNSIEYPIVLLDRLHPVIVKITLSKGSIPVHIALSYLRLSNNREPQNRRLCRKRRECIPNRKRKPETVNKQRPLIGLRSSKVMAESTPRLKIYGLRRRPSFFRRNERGKSRIASQISQTADLKSHIVSTRANKRNPRSEREKSRIESQINPAADLESPIVSTRANKRKHRSDSISQSINDAGSSVSTSSNGCSFASSRPRRVPKEPSKRGKSRIESQINPAADLESHIVSTRANKRKHRSEREKNRIEGQINPAADLESPIVSTRANKRKHRSDSISQSINDAGSSVSTSSNGCSFASSRPRRVPKEPSKRQPLAPLHYSFSTDDDSPMTPQHKVSCPRVRNRSPTPHTSPHVSSHVSPHASSLTSLPTPRKRQHRFRLLRAKNVEWDETLVSEKLENQHLTRLRAAGGKWRRKNARELVLQKAKQAEPVSWSDFLIGMTKENFIFLGEGDFSEVYCYSSGKVSIAIKVMPAVGDDDKEAPAEIKGYSHYLPEIMASKLVTKLAYKFHENRTHGFAKLMGMYVVQGRLPAMLRSVRESAANMFEEDTFSDLPASQEWLVLKYPFVGKPLDSIDMMDVPPQAMRSIVAQIAISLAAAERVYEFEHRDLHFGNILVQNVRFDRLRYRVDGENFSVPSEGLMVTIIDFTLARVKDEDGEIYFVDLANDEEEDEEDVQTVNFLDHLKVHYETKEMNRNRWNVYNPSSNIIWLKYLCNKFLHILNALPMGERLRKRNDNAHNAIHSELQVLEESMSCFNSCSELVRANFFFDSFRKSKDDLY